MDRRSRREPPPVTARSDAVSSSLPPTVVLIADGDAETRTLYCQAFAAAGCDVVEATDGRDALAKAFPSPPSLVITELTLAFVNGYTLCDILRRDPLTAGVPILVVTAAHAAERVGGIGVDALLLKPTAPDSLVREARRLLATPRALRAASGVAQVAPIAHHQQSADLRASKPHRGISYAKAHQRFTTASPPKSPPVLSCPSCDRTLKYEQSHVGGVSDRHAEQWDYFVCPGRCGVFQYRQRTRRVRRVE
jgi:CheY-like chemotaxis protein